MTVRELPEEPSEDLTRAIENCMRPGYRLIHYAIIYTAMPENSTEAESGLFMGPVKHPKMILHAAADQMHEWADEMPEELPN